MSRPGGGAGRRVSPGRGQAASTSARTARSRDADTQSRLAPPAARLPGVPPVLADAPDFAEHIAKELLLALSPRGRPAAARAGQLLDRLRQSQRHYSEQLRTARSGGSPPSSSTEDADLAPG